MWPRHCICGIHLPFPDHGGLTTLASRRQCSFNILILTWKQGFYEILHKKLEYLNETLVKYNKRKTTWSVPCIYCRQDCLEVSFVFRVCKICSIPGQLTQVFRPSLALCGFPLGENHYLLQDLVFCLRSCLNCPDFPFFFENPYLP